MKHEVMHLVACALLHLCRDTAFMRNGASVHSGVRQNKKVNKHNHLLLLLMNTITYCSCI
jgi:hypothetical protein